MRCRIFLLILLVCCLYSCSPVYVPNAHNTPLFSGAHEFKGAVNVGTAGTNILTAYSVSNHVGLMANGMFANNKSFSRDQYRNHRFGEVGIGVFDHQNRFSMELYSGFGVGKGYAEDSMNGFFGDPYLQTMSGTYNRFFIQPACGFGGKHVRANFGVRFSDVNFQTLHAFQNNEPMLISKHDRWFFEPTASISVYPTGEKFYFFAQGAASALMNNSNGEKNPNIYEIDYSIFQLSVGFGIHLVSSTTKN